MDDVYLNNFSKDLQEAIRKKTRKKYKHKDEIEMLTKQKEYLQNQLRKAGEAISWAFNRLKKRKEETKLQAIEIKNLKAEVKYERELRLKGAKYHNG